MCWAPLGAGTAAVRHGDPAAAEVDVDVVVVVVEVLEPPAAGLVAEPAAVELLDDELELEPHPAITRTAARIGNAFRTGAKQSRSPRGDPYGVTLEPCRD